MIWIDGFDHYTDVLHKWDVASVLQSGDIRDISINYARSGLGGIKFKSTIYGSNVVQRVIAQTDTLYFGFAYYPVISFGSQGRPIGVFDANTRFIIGLEVGGSGVFNAIRTSNSGTQSRVLIGAASEGHDLGQWQYIEFGFKLATTADGWVIIRKNGIEILNLQNVITVGANILPLASAAQLGSTAAGISGASSGPFDFNVDDFYMNDTGFLGDCKVSTYFMASETETAWTPNGQPTNLACIIDNPPNITDFVSASAVDTVDLYKSETVTTIQPIKAVQVSSLVMKDDSGAKTMRHGLKIAGTLYPGSVDLAPNAGNWRFLSNQWTTHPVTGLPLSSTDINGADIAIKVTG